MGAEINAYPLSFLVIRDDLINFEYNKYVLILNGHFWLITHQGLVVRPRNPLIGYML